MTCGPPRHSVSISSLFSSGVITSRSPRRQSLVSSSELSLRAVRAFLTLPRLSPSARPDDSVRLFKYNCASSCVALSFPSSILSAAAKAAPLDVSIKSTLRCPPARSVIKRKSTNYNWRSQIILRSERCSQQRDARRRFVSRLHSPANNVQNERST